MLTYRDFPNFYSNPVIKALAKNKRWTVSGTVQNHGETKKVPISMFPINHPEQCYGQNLIWGNPQKPEDMVDLATLCENIPSATNNAYLLSLDDELLVLDVEPTASTALKQQLLATPWLYGEVSMSGHGYHLILPMPHKLETNYEHIISKPSQQIFNKSLELLFSHWVTFTRNTIQRPSNWGTIDVMDIIEPQLNAIKETVQPEYEVEIDTSGVRYSDTLVAAIVSSTHFDSRRANMYDKSRFDASYISAIISACDMIVDQVSNSMHLSYSTEDRIKLVYLAAKQLLPPRSKHNEPREYGNWLMYSCVKLYTKRHPHKKR